MDAQDAFRLVDLLGVAAGALGRFFAVAGALRARIGLVAGFALGAAAIHFGLRGATPRTSRRGDP